MRLHAEENVVAQPPIDLHYPQPLAQALQRLAERQRGPQRHLRPVGIIGPCDGGAQVCAAAREVACALAQAGMAIVCGGRGGVMAAASQGAREGGGIAIGILPEEDARNANPWLSVAIATGMGEMRNALVARSALCLAAIGGNMGTLSEMALGLKWGTPVFVLHGDVALPGAVQVADAQEMLTRLVDALLAARS